MSRIGILTCSNATGELGCSASVCLRDLRKRAGEFARYPKDSPLALVGIISCPGCPTLTGPQKLLERVRALTEFRLDTIHLTYCLVALCPFKNKYIRALKENFPQTEIVCGTHESHLTHHRFRDEVAGLFCQPRRTMTDLILGRHKESKQ